MSPPLNCIIGSNYGRDETSKITRVEYWYGIESTQEYTPSLTYELEGEISDVAKASISWCYGGGRRMLDDGSGYYVDENGRRLSIMAFNSGPVDLPYSSGRGECCIWHCRNMRCCNFEGLFPPHSFAFLFLSLR